MLDLLPIWGFPQIIDNTFCALDNDEGAYIVHPKQNLSNLFIASMWNMRIIVELLLFQKHQISHFPYTYQKNKQNIIFAKLAMSDL